MFIDEQKFCNACVRFGLVLDANMIILYIVGNINPEKIPDYNITSRFTIDDYKMLKHFTSISHEKRIITTPYIISEVSHNLGMEPNREKRGKPLAKPEAFDGAIGVLQWIKDEWKYSTKHIVEKHGDKAVLRFGIPDLSLVEAVNKKCAFLSSDQQLCDEMTRKGIPALHYARARIRYQKLNLDKILKRT